MPPALVHHERKEPAPALGSNPGDVRRDKDVRELDERRVRRQGLGVEHVQACNDVAALQAIPAPTILAAAAKVGVGGAGGSGPILDGVAITRAPFLPDAPDVSADVPILVGWCKDEWTIFTAGEPWFGTMTEADLQKRVAPLGDPGQKLLAAYRKAYPDYSPTYLWIQMISGRIMQGSEFVATAKAAKGRAPAFVWFMAWETPVEGGALRAL